MVNKRFWLGMLVMVLAFGMTVIGCDDGPTKVAEPTFPSSFIRAWIRDNFSNTLTFTSTTLKASNQNSAWNLTDVSGDSYTIATGNTTSGAITINIVNGNLEISGDSGTGENNWDGTWKPQPSFPSSFRRSWIRDNFSNTLTFTATTLKASNQNSAWNLADVSGDSYTNATGTTRATITINIVNGNLEISGDSGTGENNWNGTWKPQPSFPPGFEGTWKRDNFDNTLTFTSTTIKSSSQNYTWNLADVAGDSYTSATGTTRATITVKLVSGNLEISGDSGTGENNWNGTWKPQL